MSLLWQEVESPDELVYSASLGPFLLQVIYRKDSKRWIAMAGLGSNIKHTSPFDSYLDYMKEKALDIASDLLEELSSAVEEEIMKLRIGRR